MSIHILGNGPSIRLFDRSAWGNSDIFVGCNFSDVSLGPDFTMIIDVQATKQFFGAEAQTLKIPAVLTNRAYDYIEKTGWHKIDSSRLHIVDTMETVRNRSLDRKLAANSGQHAAVYGIQKCTGHEDTVHIWGSDSIWSNEITSSTDRIVRPSHKGPRIKPNIATTWDKYWAWIMDQYRDTEFVVHAPRGTESSVSNRLREKENLTVEVHDHEHNGQGN